MTKTAEQTMLLDILTKWQTSENASVGLCATVLERATDPVLRLAAETIQRDSLNHHRIQQFIIDRYSSGKHPGLSPDDLDRVFDLLERAVNLEDKFIDLGTSCLKSIEGTPLRVEELLVNYLILEERKHKFLLDGLRRRADEDK